MKITLLGLLLGSVMMIGVAWAEDREGDGARKDRPPPREGDGNRPDLRDDRGEGGDRNRPPPRDVRREGDRRGDGDRPPHVRLHDREGGDRVGRPDGGGQQAQQELQRRDAMIEGLRRELGRVNQQNVEMRRMLQLLEQRLSKLEKK